MRQGSRGQGPGPEWDSWKLPQTAPSFLATALRLPYRCCIEVTIIIAHGEWGRALCFSKASFLYPLVYRLSRTLTGTEQLSQKIRLGAEAPHDQKGKLRPGEVEASLGGGPALDSRPEMTVQTPPPHTAHPSGVWTPRKGRRTPRGLALLNSGVRDRSELFWKSQQAEDECQAHSLGDIPR